MFKKLSAASFVMLFLAMRLFAGANQNSDKNINGKIVADYLKVNQSTLKLTDEDLANWYLSDLTFNQKLGTAYAYVQQTVNGVKIFNGVSTACIRNGKVISFANRLHSDAAGISNSIRPSISQVDGIRKAAQHLNLTLLSDPQLIASDKNLNKSTFTSGGISRDDIKVELVLQQVNNRLRLSWNVNIHVIDGSHWWNVRIDALNGNYITKNDWTVSCEFGESHLRQHLHNKLLRLFHFGMLQQQHHQPLLLQLH
jgi:extracellular elastinolytic metalloproteinase